MSSEHVTKYDRDMKKRLTERDWSSSELSSSTVADRLTD